MLHFQLEKKDNTQALQERSLSQPSCGNIYRMNKLTMSPAGLAFTILVTIIGIVDLWLVVFKGTGNTISNFLVGNMNVVPTIPFTLGWMACHLCGGLMYPAPKQ